MKYTQKIALDLDREYRRVRRPSVAVKKGALSLDIKRILNRKKDDQDKVKDYINALHRYINVRDTIPVEQQRQKELQINPISTPHRIDNNRRRHRSPKQQRRTIVVYDDIEFNLPTHLTTSTTTTPNKPRRRSTRKRTANTSTTDGSYYVEKKNKKTNNDNKKKQQQQQQGWEQYN